MKYLTVTMKHVIVANVSLSGGPGDLPVENVALDYGIVTYEYTAQNSTTSVTHNLMDRSVT